jgi:hypothetical protein
MKPPPTFLDRLLARDPLAGLLADLGRALNAREPATGGPDLGLLGELDPNDPADLARLARRVAKVIRHHDPRFHRVLVRADGNSDEIRLHVTLDLAAPEPVRVDAIRSSHRWQVTRPEGRR